MEKCWNELLVQFMNLEFELLDNLKFVNLKKKKTIYSNKISNLDLPNI